MNIIKSFCLAIKTYSKIPMVHIYPSKENLRWSLCFLPLIGAAIGGVLMAWFWVCLHLNINNACFAAVAAAIPAVMTGGVHLKGFTKISYAMSQKGDKQKKLEMLSEQYVGSYGIISLILYYILYFGFLNEITIYGEIGMIGLGFIMSRSVCAASMSIMRCAKNSGELYKVSTAINRTATFIITTIMLLGCAFVMILLSAYIGAAVLAGLIILFFGYKFILCKKVGGITSDTCGWLIQTSELITVMIIVIIGRLV